MISSSNVRHVHHILVYKCAELTTPDSKNANGPCDDIHEEASDCKRNLLIAGWAVGAGVCVVLYTFEYITISTLKLLCCKKGCSSRPA